MQDLTQGSISKHIVRLAAPMAAGMIFQTLYVLIDLYFVSRLGDASIAGVGAAANVQFVVLALTQILSVGARELRRDVSRGAETAAAGTKYLRYYLPGLGMQFALVTMGAALRGTGITKPTMVVQVLTVVLNAILAPLLIAGWGTGKPLGVAGAGLASTISITAGVVMLAFYFIRNEKYVAFEVAHMHARLDQWKRILKIGLPAGGEFALMSVFIGMNYIIISKFGAHAQAGYSIGSRVMQSIFLPAMAIAFAAAPVAGQNVGAGKPERNTLPSLLSSASRLLTFMGPALWISSRPGFALRHLWYLSVATVLAQMITSWLLLRREFGKREKAARAPASVMLA